MHEFVQLALIGIPHNQGIKIASLILTSTVILHHLFIFIDLLLPLGVLPDQERTPIVLI